MKVFIYMLAVALISPSAMAFAGIDHGNAGDAFAAEFLFSARDVLQRLELLAATQAPLIDTAKLRSAIETTEVVSKETVVLDGMERDAANYPSQKLIELSRTRWRELRQPAETKARLTLALHEFLWVAGNDDANFKLSGAVIDRLNIPAYSPGIWLNTPGTAFATAECTGRLADGSYITVTVTTKGVTRSPDHGEVQIESGGNKFGYRFNAAEISQFFETDDVRGNTSMVGLGAYVTGEFPVVVQYAGPNYVDMDLKAVIETGGNTPAGVSNLANSMQVWKGPGFEASEQYKIANPVCSVSSNN